MKPTSVLIALFLLAASALGQSIHYETPEKPWAPDLGSHRAVVHVDKAASAVLAVLPWRRRDSNPDAKAVIVVDAKSGQRDAHVLVLSVSPESGEIVFDAPEAGDYLVYFLPGEPGRGAFPAAKYVPPQAPADEAWAKEARAANLPRVEVKRWEARTAHDRFTDMEIIATASECAAWRNAHPGAPFSVFPETRENSVRMFNFVPELWLKRAAAPEFQARINEYFPFQLGVWASQTALTDVSVKFSDFVGENGARLSASALHCLQANGTDWNGLSISHRIAIGKDQVLPLWCALDLGNAVSAGRYVGTAEVTAAGGLVQKTPLAFQISGPALADRGDSEPERLTKLRFAQSPGLFHRRRNGLEPLRLAPRLRPITPPALPSLFPASTP